MPDIKVLQGILEEHGAVRQDVDLPIPVYEFDAYDPLNQGIIGAIEGSGFYFAELCTMPYIQRLLGQKEFSSSDLRKGLSQDQGDEACIDAVIHGHTVIYSSKEEHDRIISRRRPQQTLWYAGRQVNPEKMAELIELGQAVAISKPYDRNYFLLVERQQNA